jgi:hypothetical protein
MKRIKSIHWKIVIYWFLVMSIVNVYVIPKFVNHEQITTKRILIGISVSLVTAFIMGFLSSVPKKN